MSLITSKKGQGMNYIAVTIFLFIFGFLLILFYLVYNEFRTGIIATGLYTGQAQVVGDQFLLAFRAADWLTVLLLTALIVILGITSFRLSTSRVFFIVTIIMGIFWGFISYVFNYAFTQLVTADANLQAVLVFFPRTIMICTNLHWVSLACIIVGSITLYAKEEKGQFLT